MAVWKSLRASMLREIKRSKTENGYKSAWKFWNLMGFIKPALEKSCQKAEDWNDDEKRTQLINFYSQHPSLWNHRLQEYHNKPKRQILLGRLGEMFTGKFTEKELVSTWNIIKTYFERERLRESGSKTSGAGTSKVYQSTWKFMPDMRFVADGNTEPDTPRSTLDFNLAATSDESPATSVTPPPQQTLRRKRKGSAEEEMAEKRSQWYEAAKYTVHAAATVPTAAPQAPPLTEEDMFGQYVASQLKLVQDQRRKLEIKVQIKNIFLMQQMNEMEAPYSSMMANSAVSQPREFLNSAGRGHFMY